MTDSHAEASEPPRLGLVVREISTGTPSTGFAMILVLHVLQLLPNLDYIQGTLRLSFLEFMLSFYLTFQFVQEITSAKGEGF